MPRIVLVESGPHHRLAELMANELMRSTSCTFSSRYNSDGSSSITWIIDELAFFYRTICLIDSKSILFVYTAPEYGNMLKRTLSQFLFLIFVLRAKKTVLGVRNIDSFFSTFSVIKITKFLKKVKFGCETEFMKRSIEEKVSRRVVRLPSLVDNSFFREALVFQEVKHVILIPGRINSDHKNLEILFSVLNSDLAEKFIFYMRPPDDDDLANIASNYSHVKFISDPSWTSYFSILKSSSLVFLPLNQSNYRYLRVKGSGGLYDAALAGLPLLIQKQFIEFLDGFRVEGFDDVTEFFAKAFGLIRGSNSFDSVETSISYLKGILSDD